MSNWLTWHAWSTASAHSLVLTHTICERSVLAQSMWQYKPFLSLIWEQDLALKAEFGQGGLEKAAVKTACHIWIIIPCPSYLSWIYPSRLRCLYGGCWNGMGSNSHFIACWRNWGMFFSSEFGQGCRWTEHDSLFNLEFLGVPKSRSMLYVLSERLLIEEWILHSLEAGLENNWKMQDHFMWA